MQIGIDLDGVCYDFTAAFCRYVGWDPTTVDKWEFFKDHGYSVDEFLRTCHIMIKNGLLFRRGDLLPGTKEAFDALIKQGHTIHIITDRCSLDPEDTDLIKQHTLDWLEDNGLRYDQIRFTGDKVAAAKELGLDFMIDDRIENYEALVTVCDVKLFDRPWNRSAAHAARVYSWDGFVRCVENAMKFDEGLTQWEKDLGLAEVRTREQMLEEVRVTSQTGGQKGQKLARLGSLDPKALMEVAKVAGFGEQKYSRLNYLKGYDWSLSYDACQRHLHAYWSGEDLDPESGLPHLAHAAWHCLAQLAFMIHGLGTDDRYVRPDERTDGGPDDRPTRRFKPGEEAA